MDEWMMKMERWMNTRSSEKRESETQEAEEEEEDDEAGHHHDNIKHVLMMPIWQRGVGDHIWMVG